MYLSSKRRYNMPIDWTRPNWMKPEYKRNEEKILKKMEEIIRKGREQRDMEKLVKDGIITQEKADEGKNYEDFIKREM